MIIIPARLASSRFANKVLAKINGYPMVIATANRVKELDEVIIATDSNEVINEANRYGFRAIMTSKDHKSGTDRINEVANILNLKDDEIVINVQADEPFIEKDVVQKVINRVKKIRDKDEDILMCSCYKEIDSNLANDLNYVKVVIDKNSNALYFSRSKIPHSNNLHDIYFGHLGIYGFLKKSLNEFCSLKVAPLEEIEKLEQLRALYHGKKIAMVKVQSKSFGIDTIDDFKKAIELCSTIEEEEELK